jgi:hypothetical protein
MYAAVTEAFRRNNVLAQWLAFATQALIAVSVEVGDDIGRGYFFSQHGGPQGLEDARRIVDFEAAHGLWIEPAWQLFFMQTHHIFDLTITWPDVVQVMNAVYVFGHVFVTLGVALWVYFYRRQWFRFLRNIVILCNVLALFIYENFPVAPPRSLPPFSFDRHLFTFQDTVFGVVTNGGRYIGNQIGFNEYSAMPSIHMAWAIVVGATLLLLARPLPIKALGALYPAVMLVAVVVTANHYLLDAVAAAAIVAVATMLAAAFERWWGRRGVAGPARAA